MNEEVTECMTFAEWLNGGRHKTSYTPFVYCTVEAERDESRQKARKLLEELKEQYPILKAL